MPQFAQYAPLSVRVLFKHPLRTVAVTGLLGACVALNAAVFAVVDGGLFKPLPFPAADRLATIGRDLRTSGGARPGPVSRAQLRDLQHAPGTEAVAAFTSGALAGERGVDEGLRSVAVTAGFFELLGVRPVVGRSLQADDRVAGSVVPVVIGHALWRTRFTSNPGMVGTFVMLGGLRCLVVGVAPPGFDFPLGATVWNLVDLDEPALQDFVSLSAIARLRSESSCPVEVSGIRVSCEPLRRTFSPRNAWSLLLVLVAATTLMAMTWFQVACLELARTLTRMREIGVRLAIGATRGTLATESVCQGAVMGLGALATGALVLPALLSWLVSLLPADLSLGQPIAADGRALLFSALLALGVIASFAVIPLQALVRVDPAHLLRGAATGRRRRVTAPWIIVIGQVALSTALVYLAGVTVRSMLAVSQVDLGYEPAGLVVARLPDDRAAGATPVEYERVAERLRGRPSVVAVAGSDGRPLGGPTTMVTVGRPGESQDVRTRMVCVTPGYFRTLGLPLLGGRDFNAGDTRTSDFAVIVNRPLARRLGLARWEEGRRVTAGYRARMILLLAIAAIGIALCAAGVYGGVTYAWTHVRHGVAVRLALGATPPVVRMHLLRTVAVRVAVGLAIGIAGGALAGRLGAAFLFGIAPFDVVSVAAAVLIVAVACACAAMPPTIRIGRVQPSEVLREE